MLSNHSQSLHRTSMYHGACLKSRAKTMDARPCNLQGLFKPPDSFTRPPAPVAPLKPWARFLRHRTGLPLGNQAECHAGPCLGRISPALELQNVKWPRHMGIPSSSVVGALIDVGWIRGMFTTSAKRELCEHMGQPVPCSSLARYRTMLQRVQGRVVGSVQQGENS